MITLSMATRTMIHMLGDFGIRPDGDVLIAAKLPPDAIPLHVASVLEDGALKAEFIDDFAERTLLPLAGALAAGLPKISNTYRLPDPHKPVIEWAYHIFDNIALRGLIDEVEMSAASELFAKQKILRFDIAFRPAA